MIDLLMQSLRRLRASFAKDRLDRELDAEMAHHLELAIEESLGRGLPPEEARRQALLRFGGTEQAKERQREARGLPALEALLQDARHALRSLRRDRAFAAAAVPILALAIGANIAVFSVVNAILLRPLPFRNPQELAWLSGNHGAGGLSDRTYRVDAYEAFRRASQSFSETTAFVSGRLRRSLGVLWCAVGLILLIACVNLSSLLMARLAARGRELAVRRALDAGRGRLARQMLTESLVLRGAAAALGLALAVATTSYLAHQGSISLPLMSSVRVDVAALVWTLVVALLGSVLFGLASGLRTAKRTLREALGDGGPRMSQGRMHGRLRGALVVSEVALACVLLVGAGLLLRSFLRVLDVDLGFQPSGAAAIKIDYDDGGSGARRGVILREVLERVRALPGVEGAAVSDILPLERNRSWGLMAKGRVFSEKKDYSAFVHVVTPGYFDAMGMRLREGRDFTWHDTPESEPVVIINQAAARREWPGEDPVGRLAEEPKISAGDTRVVGVVADARESGVEEAPSPAIYVPSMQADPQGAELVVRAGVPPEALAPGLMSTLRALNPGQPATELRPLQRIVDSAVSPRRFFVVLVSAFAALGLVLASLGIYGVISYSVSRQRQEIGIRMALGASRARVQLDVIARTLRLALVGIALGATASFVVARAIAGLLFETEPADPSILAATILAVAAVALVAGYIPAHRASRIDPTITLRSY
jgi:putative ABC transport system permease protein